MTSLMGPTLLERMVWRWKKAQLSGWEWKRRWEETEGWLSSLSLGFCSSRSSSSSFSSLISLAILSSVGFEVLITCGPRSPFAPPWLLTPHNLLPDLSTLSELLLFRSRG